MRAIVSITIIALGPAILATLVTTVLLNRRREHLTVLRDTRAARIILAAAAIAIAFVTIGVLIFRR